MRSLSWSLMSIPKTSWRPLSGCPLLKKLEPGYPGGWYFYVFLYFLLLGTTYSSKPWKDTPENPTFEPWQIIVLSDFFRACMGLLSIYNMCIIIMIIMIIIIITIIIILLDIHRHRRRSPRFAPVLRFRTSSREAEHKLQLEAAAKRLQWGSHSSVGSNWVWT